LNATTSSSCRVSKVNDKSDGDAQRLISVNDLLKVHDMGTIKVEALRYE
jgi:hypothetical protein